MWKLAKAGELIRKWAKKFSEKQMKIIVYIAVLINVKFQGSAVACGKFSWILHSMDISWNRHLTQDRINKKDAHN